MHLIGSPKVWNTGGNNYNLISLPFRNSPLDPFDKIREPFIELVEMNGSNQVMI
jgi:hypothetical protein